MFKRSLVAGQKFGNLTVLGFSTNSVVDRVTYRCECSCGNLVDVEENQLKSGNVRSCGCKNKKIYKAKFGGLTYFIDTDFYQERRDRVQEFEIKKMVDEINGEENESESPF